jgi:hypothetical protein
VEYAVDEVLPHLRRIDGIVATVEQVSREYARMRGVPPAA